MIRKLTAIALFYSFLGLSIIFTGGTANAQVGQLRVTAPPGFSFPLNATEGTRSFNGVLNIRRFSSAVINGTPTLIAHGNVTGTITDTATGLTTLISRSITEAVGLLPSTATCDILNLVLGPLDLDLLGLVIHLDRILLDIDAQSGPGNLLGNLLCGVSNLLNPGNLPRLGTTLNRIIGLLG
jgi:hypothetical protein